MKALRELLQSAFKVRPEEANRTVLAFVYLFTSIGAFIIGRIARTVLFLEIPDYKDKLPLVYVLIAVTNTAAMYAYARVERKLRRDVTNAITLGVLVVVTLGFRFLLATGSQFSAWAFYLWIELCGGFVVVQFWTFANEIFHSRQAKRLFALIGGGGVLANVFIGFAITSSVKALGTENLLFVISGLLLISLGTVVALGRSAREDLVAAHAKAPGGSKAAAAAAGKVFQSRHVKLIAAVVTTVYLVSTLVDYQFQVIIGDSIPGKDERSAYIAAFFGITGVIAAVIQFFFTSRILERFGVLVALVLLPAASLLGASGILFAPLFTFGAAGLWAVSATKGAENCLRYTVNDSTLQLLYLPVPAQVRGRVKAWIDGILKPVAIGGAGLLLALLVGQLNGVLGLPKEWKASVYELSVLVIVLLVAWIIALVQLRKEYLTTLLSTLQRRRLNFADAKFQITDDATVKSLEKALSSSDMGEVLHALELLPFVTVTKAREAMHARVGELLRHPSDDVRVAALEFLGGAGTALQAERIAELCDDASPAVRSAATIAYCSLVRERAIAQVHPIVEDASPEVRAHAVAGLIKSGGLDGVLACADTLKRMLVSRRAVDRKNAAWVLGEVGVQNFFQPLVPLFEDDDESVRLAAIVAAGKLKSPELVAALLAQLGHPHLANPAAAALAAYGASILEPITALMRDKSRPAELRANGCRVLAKLGDARSVELLTAQLGDASAQVRGAAITALSAIIYHSPGVRLDKAAVATAVRAEAQHAFELVALGLDLGLDDKSVLLTDAISHRAVQSHARLFGLLALKYPSETIGIVSQNLQSAQVATRANAVEVLDNLLDLEEKALVIPLFDEAPADKKLALVADHVTIDRVPRAGRLAALLAGDDDWLRVCAAVAAGAWGERGLAPAVHKLLESPSPICRETAIVALCALSDASELKGHLMALEKDPARSVSRYAGHVLAELAPA